MNCGNAFVTISPLSMCSNQTCAWWRSLRCWVIPNKEHLAARSSDGGASRPGAFGQCLTSVNQEVLLSGIGVSWTSRGDKRWVPEIRIRISIEAASRGFAEMAGVD